MNNTTPRRRNSLGYTTPFRGREQFILDHTLDREQQFKARPHPEGGEQFRLGHTLEAGGQCKVAHTLEGGNNVKLDHTLDKRGGGSLELDQTMNGVTV